MFTFLAELFSEINTLSIELSQFKYILILLRESFSSPESQFNFLALFKARCFFDATSKALCCFKVKIECGKKVGINVKKKFSVRNMGKKVIFAQKRPKQDFFLAKNGQNISFCHLIGHNCFVCCFSTAIVLSSSFIG